MAREHLNNTKKHSTAGQNIFYTHHHLKEPHKDAVRSDLQWQGDHYILRKIYLPGNYWKEISISKEIEKLITQRNKSHLQQSNLEQSRIHDSHIHKLIENHGTNELVDQLLNDTILIEDVADEQSKHGWNQSEKQYQKYLPIVIWLISREDFQNAFRAVKERTTSLPLGLHYSIWKAISTDNDLSEGLSIMMSLLFLYDFINT